MKNNPLITIATVVYNAEKTLERTLHSVAEQDYPHVEHLIVDGCSKDNTLQLAQSYINKNTHSANPRKIQLISERDKGLYDAMNKAIKLATGDYLVFLNAGDKLKDKHTLTTLVAQLEWDKDSPRNPAIIYGETDLVDDNGTFIRHRRLSAPETLSWRSFLNGMLVCHQSFYIRTDLAKEELYDLQYRFSADFDWCIRLMKMAAKKELTIVNTHMILTDYLSEGLTTQNHRKSLAERFLIMAHHYGWFAATMQHLWFLLRALIKR